MQKQPYPFSLIFCNTIALDLAALIITFSEVVDVLQNKRS